MPVLNPIPGRKATPSLRQFLIAKRALSHLHGALLNQPSRLDPNPVEQQRAGERHPLNEPAPIPGVR